MSQPTDNTSSDRDTLLKNNSSKKLLNKWLPAVLITIVVYAIGVVVFMMIDEYKKESADSQPKDSAPNSVAQASIVEGVAEEDAGGKTNNKSVNADDSIDKEQPVKRFNVVEHALAAASNDEAVEDLTVSATPTRAYSGNARSNRRYTRKPTYNNSRSKYQRRRAANAAPRRSSGPINSWAQPDESLPDDMDYNEEVTVESPNDIILLSRDLPGVIEDSLENKRYDEQASEVETINNKISNSIETVKRQNTQAIEARQPQNDTKSSYQQNNQDNDESNNQISASAVSAAPATSINKPNNPKPVTAQTNKSASTNTRTTKPVQAAANTANQAANNPTNLKDNSKTTYRKVEPTVSSNSSGSTISGSKTSSQSGKQNNKQPSQTVEKKQAKSAASPAPSANMKAEAAPQAEATAE